MNTLLETYLKGVTVIEDHATVHVKNGFLFPFLRCIFDSVFLGRLELACRDLGDELLRNALKSLPLSLC